MKTMKHSIDNQIDLKIPQVCIIWAPCLSNIGFKASMYKTKLVEEGIYMPTMIRKFDFPCDHTNFIGIPRPVECLYLVKVNISYMYTLFERIGTSYLSLLLCY
ncbi:uncharacterized protein B0P05DRAFT_553169 [Gilbertella persicaria]|uniref:uncharacterized protein n=1 Tax=Gilbertella persicaria TaxID=101096 RepID=UPI00221FE6C4|nr:uncharacterized protein B0P05DRAFT_553169 [Gilbertella persicaria]KAI8066999.1 hypothetical protein B0P05DRAFT_553169 [Gilbertella persicaria]